MGKNIRRGRTGSVRCASCGQITRRDRAVYLFRDGIKAYYCPDCAKKIHGQRLYKGMPKYVKRTGSSKVKRKFTIFAKDEIGSENTVDEVPEEVHAGEDADNLNQENNKENEEDKEQ
jgi:NAD-dependent SIR2 family protein deacetylase